MKKTDFERLKRDVNELGILNIEASGNITVDSIEDAVKAVKFMDKTLDIDAILDENNQNINKYLKHAR
ncbi:MAG: hypothetical protein ACTTKC_02610 [Treponema sp.]|uniref:hypothetical protein n=1 Tax=Treponema sp. TaxID=166 RepID=UPI003FA2ACA0